LRTAQRMTVSRPYLSALAFKPIQFHGCSESRTVPKAGLHLL
jgi:hypothetical protein